MPHVHDYRNAKGGVRYDGWTDEEWNGTFNHYKNQSLADLPDGGPCVISYEGYVEFKWLVEMGNKDGSRGGWIEDVAWYWYASRNNLDTSTEGEHVTYALVMSAVVAYIIHFDLPGDIEILCAYARQRLFNQRGWRVRYDEESAGIPAG